MRQKFWKLLGIAYQLWKEYIGMVRGFNQNTLQCAFEDSSFTRGLYRAGREFFFLSNLTDVL